MAVAALQKPNRKRKADAQDSKASSDAAPFDELGNDLSHALNGQTRGQLEELNSTNGWNDTQFDILSSPEGSQSEDSDGESGLEFENEDLDSDSAYSEDEGRGMTSNYTITEDANGNPRYVYREVVPGYDSDDSDAPANQNTIGNIPLSFYDSYPHIGYDIDGKKMMRPAKGNALDSLLDSIDIPKGWTGLTDPATGKPLTLNEEELEVLKRLTRNEVVEDGYDPYPDMVEYFTGNVEPMPLSSAPEPKRRFVPSKHEAKRVMKLVKAIKEGRIQPYRPPSDNEQESDVKNYDIWAEEAPRPDHPMNMPAPKLPPPTYDESYHPPPEYLPDEKEKKEWHEADAEDREKDYLPTNHDALRKVPGYDQFVKEKFERCLDLYLAPRVRRSKLNIDPESLLPKLPSPEELRPFPARCDLVFSGHTGRVRSAAIDPCGSLLATGGDDGFVRIWALRSGREVYKVRLSNHEAVNVVQWRPGKEAFILAAAVEESVFLIASPISSILGAFSDSADAGRELLTLGWATNDTEASKQATSDRTASAAQWIRPETRIQQQGVLVQVKVRSTIKIITWHRRGEYFATVSPQGQSGAIAIHTLSKHQTQLPFKKLKGFAQSAQFHPSKPIFFVATQRTIRSYDLVQQELVKTLQPGAKWISSFDVHPGGDNVLVGSFDKRLLWIDVDLSTRPYKTLRYHSKAIRSVKYHQGGYPLFADASDDGTIQIFHGKVVGDLMENANIVPLKVLRGHSVEKGLGVLDLDWHPTEPYCVSAGADGTCRLWRP